MVSAADFAIPEQGLCLKLGTCELCGRNSIVFKFIPGYIEGVRTAPKARFSYMRIAYEVLYRTESQRFDPIPELLPC
jgi:hypothetical protein